MMTKTVVTEMVSITPDMIRAGLDAMTSHYFALTEPDIEFYPVIIRDVYLAMYAARPGIDEIG